MHKYDNDIKCILFEGGLNHQESPQPEHFSCRELRRARMELLYKEYEVSHH